MLMEWIDKKPFKFVIFLSLLVLIIEYVLEGLDGMSKMFLIGIINFFFSFLLSVEYKYMFKVKRGRYRGVLDYRFPSLHTAIGTSMSVAPLLVNTVFFPLLILIPITMYNRIHLKKHNLVEVFCGFVLGLIVVEITIFMLLNIYLGGVFLWMIIALPKWLD